MFDDQILKYVSDVQQDYDNMHEYNIISIWVKKCREGILPVGLFIKIYYFWDYVHVKKYFWILIKSLLHKLFSKDIKYYVCFNSEFQ